MCQTVPDQVDEIVNLKKCTLVGHLPVHKSRRVRVQLRLANSKAINEPGSNLLGGQSDVTLLQVLCFDCSHHSHNSHQLLRITSQK